MTMPPRTGDAEVILHPAALGFRADGDGWLREVGGRTLRFHRVRTRAEFAGCERLQRDVFGVSESDLASFSILVIIPKTGGEILGVTDPASGELIGYIQGYGGFVNRQPVLISDLMAVLPDYRGGVGYALKTLQACVALADGFSQMTWTVDPLRAANARLNHERLGATAREYGRDLYGTDFAGGLYGGMPSDRLIVHWDLLSTRVHQRLLRPDRHTHSPLTADALAHVPAWGEQTDATTPVHLHIPRDIDALLAHNPESALAERLRLRDALEAAFAAGYRITGFIGDAASATSAFVLTPDTPGQSVRG